MHRFGVHKQGNLKMKKSIVSSVFVAAILLTSVSATQARNINNRVSQANINQYCADKVAGQEYRVSITTSSGATITGEIQCGSAIGTIVDRGNAGTSSSRNDDNGRNGHDDDRGGRDNDDRGGRDNDDRGGRDNDDYGGRDNDNGRDHDDDDHGGRDNDHDDD